MSGMYQEIADAGLERDELGRSFGQALIGGERIPYEPKELGGMITMIRPYNPKRYLAIEAFNGGWKYIKKTVGIGHVTDIQMTVKLDEFKKIMRDKDLQPFDLVSIDTRGFQMSVDEIWKYILGGRDPQIYGKGAPTDYGPRKVHPGSLIIFNLSSVPVKELYFRVRSMDNKMHQSKYAGMIKWT